MKLKVGLENGLTVYRKFNRYNPDEILDKLGNIEGDVTIISPTVPYDICEIIVKYYDCHITVIYNHPAMDMMKEYFKNIVLLKMNIYTKEVNNHIKGTVVLHDFQYMAPLEYLPYKLTNYPIIFYNESRTSFDEEINQNFYINN